MSQLITCVNCGGLVSDNAEQCIHCKEKNFRPQRCVLCGEVVSEDRNRILDPTLSRPWRFSPLNQLKYLGPSNRDLPEGGYIHDNCLKSFNEHKQQLEDPKKCDLCKTPIPLENLADHIGGYDYSDHWSTYTCPSCGNHGQSKYFGKCEFCALQIVNNYNATNLYSQGEKSKTFHRWCAPYFQKFNTKWSESDPTPPPSESVHQKQQGEPCFIATTVYEGPYAPEVTTFRAFRDNHLAQSEIGRLFIEAYYATSPPIARLLARNQPLREMMKRLILNPILRVIERQRIRDLNR